SQMGKINNEIIVSLYKNIFNKEFLGEKYKNEGQEFLEIYRKFVFGINENKFDYSQVYGLATQFHSRIVTIKLKIYFKELFQLKENEEVYLKYVPYRIERIYAQFTKTHVGEYVYKELFKEFRVNFAVFANQMNQNINHKEFKFTKKDILKTIFMLNKLLMNIEYKLDLALKRNLA
ncbi:MAG: hypothetical protein KC589_05045, partial [Nanoarchaeota archaeon]|nr:hypothetical protein [Nanoarchaeota archaeon]